MESKTAADISQAESGEKGSDVRARQGLGCGMAGKISACGTFAEQNMHGPISFPNQPYWVALPPLF